MNSGALLALAAVVILAAVFFRPLLAARQWVKDRLGPYILVAVGVAYLYFRLTAAGASTPQSPVGLILATSAAIYVLFWVVRLGMERRMRRRIEDLLSRPYSPRPAVDGPRFGHNSKEVEVFIDQVARLSADERLEVLVCARRAGGASVVTGSVGWRYRRAEKTLSRVGHERELERASWAVRDALDISRQAVSLGSRTTPQLEHIDFLHLAERAAQGIVVQDIIEQENFAVLLAPFSKVFRESRELPPGKGDSGA